MEQRQHVRTSLDGMTAYISDQAGLCRGILKDMSKYGLCITDLPRKLCTDDGVFSAVINGKGYNFKLQLKEKWKQDNGLVTMVGAGIDDAFWDGAELMPHHKVQNRNMFRETVSSHNV